MQTRQRRQYDSSRFLVLTLLVVVCSGIASSGLAQDRQGYLPGEGNTVEMIVHIIGEVQKPGKYRVRDDTNLMELLSEAGGATDFSNLNKVTITRALTNRRTNGRNGSDNYRGARIIWYNINKYLKENRAPALPILKPGDVVLVPKNSWRTWRNVATIVRDISVIASAYFLYLRATR